MNAASIEEWAGAPETSPPDDDVPEASPEDVDGPVSADPCRCAGAARVPDARLAAWIDAIVEQDERALADLYDTTFSHVYGLVHRIVRRTTLAEEVVEDTYFQVWRQAARFDAARGTAMAWLLAMARSRAIDALRREARFQHESLEQAEGAELDGQAAGSDELLDLARHHADLHRALMLLGAQPRQLVSLAFFRGLSHEEIAAQTQLPLGTVKSQIRRALITLRQAIGETGLRPLAAWARASH